MKDVIQTYRDSKGRYTNKGYAFDDDKLLEILNKKVDKIVKKALWLGALVGLTVGIGISIWL